MILFIFNSLYLYSFQFSCRVMATSTIRTVFKPLNMNCANGFAADERSTLTRAVSLMADSYSLLYFKFSPRCINGYRQV